MTAGWRWRPATGLREGPYDGEGRRALEKTRGGRCPSLKVPRHPRRVEEAEAGGPAGGGHDGKGGRRGERGPSR
eukprot:scaffold105333_cov16-Prasinocladus_malaysianus.AAC.1